MWFFQTNLKFITHAKYHNRSFVSHEVTPQIFWHTRVTTNLSMLSLAVFTVSLLVNSLDSSVLLSSAYSQRRSLGKITNTTNLHARKNKTKHIIVVSRAESCAELRSRLHGYLTTSATVLVLFTCSVNSFGFLSVVYSALGMSTRAFLLGRWSRVCGWRFCEKQTWKMPPVSK